MDRVIALLQADFGDWGKVHDVDGLIKQVKSDLGAKGFTAGSSRVVFSVCPDEINRLRERRTIEGAMASAYDGDFHMGTLAAYPIGGVTGIAAASHHAPERHVKGACIEGDVIFFASPHVGIVPGTRPTYGNVVRPGQEHETPCCGAMMGFLNALKKAKTCSSLELDLDDPLDIARQIVFCELAKQYKSELDIIIKNEDENKQVIELAKINHDLVKKSLKRMLDAFLSKNKCENRYALVSGITINAPGEDYFVLKEISILKG
ncbi:MAG: hypothetical protein Q6373_021270 [Candidatus Sigynarchaeota archaeon]